MENKNLIGRKVKGFKFESYKYGKLFYDPDGMDKHIGKEGVIREYFKEYLSYVVVFDAGSCNIWEYPEALIERHLVPEENQNKTYPPTPDEVFPVKEEYIQSSGRGKRTFESGSKRDADDNKPIPMELNPYMLLRYGYHMKSAQQHYGDGNWELSQPDLELWRSFSRHFTQAYFNYKFPELAKQTDDGSDHLSAMIFAINMLMHNESRNGVPADKFFKDKKPSNDTQEVFNYTVKGKHTTQDLGDKLFNPDIWPEPFPKPSTLHLGVGFQHIHAKNIPYNCIDLKEGDRIENEFGETLQYMGDDYWRLLVNEQEKFLANWFSKWRKV